MKEEKMSNYLFAYHGGKMPETEEEIAKVTAEWSRWYNRIGQEVVDPGKPVIRAKSIASTGHITNGGGADPVSGYTIVKAPDIEAAAKLAKDCPILKTGGRIEVCETVDMM